MGHLCMYFLCYEPFISYHSYQSLVSHEGKRVHMHTPFYVLPPICNYPVAGLCSIFWYSWAVDLQRNYQWSIFWGTCNKLLLMVHVKFFFCCYFTCIFLSVSCGWAWLCSEGKSHWRLQWCISFESQKKWLWNKCLHLPIPDIPIFLIFLFLQPQKDFFFAFLFFLLIYNTF